jgi:hypothetical protein
MFRAEIVQARLREQPFRPLRIIASEGLRYDIHHPDLVLVGERDLVIGSPSRANPTIYNQITRVAMVHIVALEDLPTPAAPATVPPNPPPA